MNPYPTRLINSLLLLHLFLVSCSQTAVRLPPGITEAELSSVYFYSTNGIDTSYIAVDGVGQGIFDSGLKVAPGEHEAGCDFKFTDQQCYWGNYCVDTIFYGSCRATFRAEAGREYSVKLTRASSSVYISVVDARTSEVAGSGNCENKRTAPVSTRAEIKLH